MKIFEKVFGIDKEKMMKEKVGLIDSGPVQYIGGHKAYPKPQICEIFFYEDRFEIVPYHVKVYYNKISDILNSKDRKRDSERLVAGLLFAPVALSYLWKKDHIYTIIEYDDGNDIQRIVLDFENNANYAQGLIYKKMLESRNE
jgi:hypothetical protein